MLVLSHVHVGSTMLLNLVRFLMESQYPAVGNFVHLPGEENRVLEMLDTLKTPAIVKTHSRNIDWWMQTKRRDGSPLVDAIVTASRDPADALCSFFTTQKRTTFPDDWDLFTMLGKLLWIEQFVIKFQGQQALALSLDIGEINDWPRALKIIAMALGIELAPAVLDNILARMALLRPSALATDAHPVTRLQPKDGSHYMAENIRLYRKQCAAEMQEMLENLPLSDRSGQLDDDYVTSMMVKVGTFPPIRSEWVRSWSKQRRSLGECGSGFGAETMCRVGFLTLPIRLLDTVSSSLVVRCRPHSYVRTLRCRQETEDSLDSSSVPPFFSDGRDPEPLGTSIATASAFDGPVRRSAALLDQLLSHHCKLAPQGQLSRRSVVVDLSCGAGQAALRSLAAGCNVLCVEADSSMAQGVARAAVQRPGRGLGGGRS